MNLIKFKPPSNLTERQQKILDFIVFSKQKFGYPPSITEIQKKFSFASPNSVTDHLDALIRKGYISRLPNKSRGIKVLSFDDSEINNTDNTVQVPIVGQVAAGIPILAEKNLEGTLSVDRSIIKNPQHVFALKVKGSSMINAGILDGDFVLVRQQPTAEQGEIVVVLLEDEATIKRFYKHKDKFKLMPENDSMEPIIIDSKQNNVNIIGKVKGVIRKI